MTADKYDISFWSDDNVLTLIAIVAAQLYDYTKNTRIAYFKWVN